MKLGSGKGQTRRILVIAALIVAGICGVAACGAAVQATSQPRPPSAAPMDSATMARDIAGIAMGNGGLAALDNGDGMASLAYCDPATVSGRIHVSTPVSASCGISYSDGSVWRQTVTVSFDGLGGPVTDRASLGTELLQPAGG
jgi:hypothetical protein